MMDDQEAYAKWMLVLNSARKVASEDLKSSNDLLELTEHLMALKETEHKASAETQEIAKALVDVALKLTENSRILSSAISKLVGAI